MAACGVLEIRVEPRSQPSANNSDEVIEIDNFDEENDNETRSRYSSRNVRDSPHPYASSSSNGHRYRSRGNLCCSNCEATFACLIEFQAHLLDHGDCFFKMIKPYWVQHHSNLWKCGFCESILASNVELKEHCLSQTTCKLNYINLLARDVNSGGGRNAFLQSHTTPLRGTPQPYFPPSTIPPPTALTGAQTMELEDPHASNTSLTPQATPHNVDVVFADIGEAAESCTSADPNEEQFMQGKETRHGTHFIRIGVRSESANTPRCDKAMYGDPQLSRVPNRVGKKHPLRSNSVRNKLSCKACQRLFDSPKELKKHRFASARCKRIIRDLESADASCLQCGMAFSNEDEKYRHIVSSATCNQFLKTMFEKGQFHESSEFFQNCSMSSNMCHYCKFTSDDDNLFSHLLQSKKCRNDLEKAILRYKINTMTEESDLASPAIENGQAISEAFPCGDCERSFCSERALRSHKAQRHGCSASTRATLEKGTASKVGDHLYCFKCKKYLKTENEVKGHMCGPTRLLSRFCKSKAVWKEGEYQCNICSPDRFFHWRDSLKKHMYTHDKDKNRSQLFNYVSSDSGRSSKAHATVIKNDKSNRPGHKEQAPPSTALKCGHCNEVLCDGKKFKHHVLASEECLMHYDHPRNECYDKSRGCYVCKRHS